MKKQLFAIVGATFLALSAQAAHAQQWAFNNDGQLRLKVNQTSDIEPNVPLSLLVEMATTGLNDCLSVSEFNGAHEMQICFTIVGTKNENGRTTVQLPEIRKMRDAAKALLTLAQHAPEIPQITFLYQPDAREVWTARGGEGVGFEVMADFVKQKDQLADLFGEK